VKKLGFILVAIAAIVIGLLVGTLNSSPVQLDLLWVQLELPLGLSILLGFSVGIILGMSAVYLVRVVPLRLKLRKATANLANKEHANLSLPDD